LQLLGYGKRFHTAWVTNDKTQPYHNRSAGADRSDVARPPQREAEERSSDVSSLIVAWRMAANARSAGELLRHRANEWNIGFYTLL